MKKLVAIVLTLVLALGLPTIGLSLLLIGIFFVGLRIYWLRQSIRTTGTVLACSRGFRRQQMIRTARERNVLPVVLTCMIPDQQGVPAWFDDHERVRKFLEQYDQMLTEYCRNEQICLISTHTLTPGYTDGVHPDKEGYRILGEYISREFRNLLSLQQNRPEDLTI